MTRQETAADVAARLATDSEYQEKKQALERTVAQQLAELDSQSKPILSDLSAAGLRLTTIADSTPLQNAYPLVHKILLTHLADKSYPSSVRQCLALGLAVKQSIEHWDTLLDLYRTTDSREEMEALANVLDIAATPAVYEDLIPLVKRKDRGTSRILLLKPILSKGGERGREFVEFLTDDQVLGIEAKALLKRRLQRRPKKSSNCALRT